MLERRKEDARLFSRLRGNSKSRSLRGSHFVLMRITLLSVKSEIVSRKQLVKEFDCAETRRFRNQIRVAVLHFRLL